MAHAPRDQAAVAPDGDDAPTDDVSPPAAAARTPDGRFGEGQCGNPRGRPRKPPAEPLDVLRKVLDEKVPCNIPGQPALIAMREALARSLCIRGLKDARIAFSILKLDVMSRSAPDEVEPLGALLPEEEAALEAYLERERHREQRRHASARRRS